MSLELGFVIIIWFHAISFRDIVEGCLKILSGCLFFGKILSIWTSSVLSTAKSSLC